MNASALLVTIGTIVFLLGGLSIVAGSWPKKVHKKKADNLLIKRIMGADLSLVFSVPQLTEVKGWITGGGKGPFRIEIRPDKHRGTSLDVYAFVEGPTGTPEEVRAFECKVPAGDYRILFRTTGDFIEVETRFSLTLTYNEFPYRKLFDLGLTLLEVGIPLLITGIVLLSGS